jgi:hypothetical protein
MKRLFQHIVFLAPLFLVGCTKNVTLDLPNPPPEIVVEGHIEPNNLAYLYLSHNFAFFGSTSITTIIADDVIHGAKITISDGSSTDSMTEFISTLGYYQSVKMKGQIGKTYNLMVQTGNQILTASTTILPPVKLDSAWFQVYDNMDTLGYMWAILHDPPAPGNCYRWLAKRIGKDTTYLPPDLSVFDDQFINGQKFKFYYDRGRFPGSKARDDTNIERHFFKKGETVVIKLCAIDYVSYKFYSLYYYQQANNGNPFGSPAPIVGNINGGLGIWCGYGASLDTVICK